MVSGGGARRPSELALAGYPFAVMLQDIKKVRVGCRDLKRTVVSRESREWTVENTSGTHGGSACEEAEGSHPELGLALSQKLVRRPVMTAPSAPRGVAE